MNYPPFRQNHFQSGAVSSLPSHRPFPRRTLFTVPENETESCANLSSSRSPSPPHLVPSNGHATQSPSRELDSCSFNSPPAYAPTPQFAQESQTFEKQGARRRRACGWIIPARLVLHIITFAASITIIGLLAQALLSHRRLRQVRQFNGSDSAWPKQMSLTPSIVLLSVASTGVVKSAICVMAEAQRRSRLQSPLFLFGLTASSAAMGALWLLTAIFVETKGRSSDDFATWACARSGAAVNQIVPYSTICNEVVRCRSPTALAIADTK